MPQASSGPRPSPALQAAGEMPPNGPAGVTVGISEVGQRINVSISFHDNVVPGELVEALLELLVDDPAGLLEDHRSGTRQPAGA